MATGREHRWTYTRPHRDLVMHGVNVLGGVLRRCGWRRPLRVDELLATAVRETRLSDWGDDSFREPLARLVEATEQEARLTPLGRLLFRKAFVHQLSNRLRVQAALSRSSTLPDVRRPLFVLGLPRTGTTLLFNLLAEDAGRRALLTHESIYPLGRGSSDGRRETRRLVWLMNRMAPGLKAVHPLEADVPEECTFLLSNTFTSPHFMMQAHIPSYADWLFAADPSVQQTAYRYLRTQLQLMHRPHDDRGWLLKSPALLGWLDQLLAVFPEACIVQTHRRLDEVAPSTCSLFAVLRGLYSDDVDPQALGPELMTVCQRLLSRPGVAASDQRVRHVQYTDLVARPLEVVQEIYDHFGLKPSAGQAERMQTWLTTSRRSRYAGHAYSLEQFGLTAESVRAADLAG
jgi:hypothetical protein